MRLDWGKYNVRNDRYDDMDESDRRLEAIKKRANLRADRRRANKGSKKRIIYPILMVVFIGIAAFSVFQLVNIFLKYQQGDEAYEEIESIGVKKSEIFNDVGEVVDEIFYVDFVELQKINNEVVGWIRFNQPEIISYPIVHTVDNEKYLTTTFEGEQGDFGALFVDMENKGSFIDSNTLIYGHNMHNGSMFGELHNYVDEEYYKENPYFYVYTLSGKEITYQICAVEEVSASSPRYQKNFANSDEFQGYINEMLRTSFYDTGVAVDSASQIVTLSTCTNNDETRFIVQGVKIEEKDMVEGD